MRAGVAAVLAGVLMLALSAAVGAQGADTTCQFALTRLDATTTNVLVAVAARPYLLDWRPGWRR